MSHHATKSPILAAYLLLLGAMPACIPYTVATTAEPVKVGQRSTTLVTYAMPSVKMIDSARADRPSSASTLASDMELRWGADDRSDVGVRVTSMSGIVLNYKHLISAPASRTAVAIMPGAGIVNAGQHAHMELTLLASRREPKPEELGAALPILPYGGLRIMQVAPIAEGAVKDEPTIGGFVGVRIGRLDWGVSPEVGVFHDPSAMHVRKRSTIVVPAISVHGDAAIHALRGLGGLFGMTAGVARSPQPPQPATTTAGEYGPRMLPPILQPAYPPRNVNGVPVGGAKGGNGTPANHGKPARASVPLLRAKS